MNAARALSRAGLDGEEVFLALHPIDPENINLYPASYFLRSLWAKGIHGITLGKGVFVDPAILDGDPHRLGRLTLHELTHLRQISDLGLGRFLWRYLRDYARGRLRRLDHNDAYREIGLEAEARRTTDRLSQNVGPR